MKPKIHESCFIADSAVIIGEVTLEEGVSVWDHAVIRADLGPITVGKGSNIQECCVIHVTTEHAATIGENVSVGHCAMIHGAAVGDDTIVGINSTLLDGVVVGAGSVIGANCMVREGMKIPPGSVVVGVPGKIIKEGNASLLGYTRKNAEVYHMLRDRHKAGEFERYMGSG